MSRQIKFRVWDKEMKYFSSQYDLYCSNGSISNDETVHPHGGRFVAQQFTGLLANNWREIYEGDIVLAHNYNDPHDVLKCVVEFSQHSASFFLRHVKESNISLNFSRCGSSANTEIIGNIYENPELLK